MSKNKLKIGIILMIIILIITIIVCLIEKENNKKIVQKGYEIFGNDYCQGHRFTPECPVEDGWTTCNLCGRNMRYVVLPIYKLCHSCEKKTGRCHKCGKLYKSNK